MCCLRCHANVATRVAYHQCVIGVGQLHKLQTKGFIYFYFFLALTPKFVSKNNA